MSDKSMVISAPIKTRRKARLVERVLQENINEDRRGGISYDGVSYLVPSWAQGVRVDRAGFRQFVVVATEHKGH